MRPAIRQDRVRKDVDRAGPRREPGMRLVGSSTYDVVGGFFGPDENARADCYGRFEVRWRNQILKRGRLDFYSLENSIVGRGKRYQRMVIDEAAFAKNGDNRSDDSLMAIWEKALKPTLIDFAGEVLVCSNSAGKNPDNFFFNICTDPQYGFKEFHATTLDNPLLPKRLLNESLKDWATRRVQFLDDLKRDNDPLVYAQEYLAEFVDWSGAAFFSREKLLVDNLPVTILPRCEYVYAVIDTASKTGTDHDATAVTFFALDRMTGNPRPIILDWDIAQIEGGVLEHWLPSVFLTLEELARLSHTRLGSAGAFIEDKNSGTILLQQAARRGMPARAIESKLTAMGKDELGLGLRSPRDGQIQRPRLQQDGRLQATIEKPFARPGRKFSGRRQRQRPRRRPPRHLLLRDRAGRGE